MSEEPVVYQEVSFAKLLDSHLLILCMPNLKSILCVPKFLIFPFRKTFCTKPKPKTDEVSVTNSIFTPKRNTE